MTNGTADYAGTVVVIPTRDRAALAANAIRSVLDQQSDDVRVLVSDNSISEPDRESLEKFCSTPADPRLRYVRPPQPLAMTAHWEWAMRQALSFYEVNHFLYLTDRMMFKPRGLKPLLDIAALYPDKIVTYHHDRIDDHARPIRVEQYPWTGKLLEVETLHLSSLYSQTMLHPGLPRMLNSVVPRRVLELVRRRFGSVFASIAPDYNFGFRCLEVLDSVIFYDKSPIFHYGLNRSNGASFSRGVATRDSADFIKNLGDATLNFASPIPQMMTVGNAVIHEYCLVKQETGSPRFFDIDKRKYVRYLAKEIDEIENTQLKEEMRALIDAHGGVTAGGDDASPPAAPVERTASTLARKLLSPRAVFNKLRWVSKPVRDRMSWPLKGAATKPGWLFLARHFNVKPPDANRFEFNTVEEAVDFIKKFPRRRWQTWEWQQELLKARELPAPEHLAHARRR